MNRRVIFFVVLFLPQLSWAQYRLYEEGIKKYNEKDYYAAIELFSDFLTKPLHDKKFDADTYYWRGLSAFKLNDYEAASEDLKLSASLNHPNAGNIHWFLAKSLEKLDKDGESIESYGNALKLLEKDKAKKSQLLSERAQVYVKMNKHAEALQDVQAASVLAPNDQALKDEVTRLSNARTASVASNTTAKPENKKDTNTKGTANPLVAKKEEVKQETLAKEENKNQPGPATQKQEEKQEEKKEEKNIPNSKKKDNGKELVAKNEAATKNETANTDTRKLNEPPVVNVPPVTTAEPTLAELYKDEKRYALVIGNSAYPKQIGVLKNPVNDATDFASSLKTLGFEVTLITDASYGKIRAEMMKFRDKLNLGEREKTVGLFYYAGHGLQSDNENYIVPVDAELQYEDDIARYCFPIQKMVLTQMENTNSRMNIVILDACRNNPFPAIHRGIGEGQGLGELKKARGAFIAYATSPGSVASDGTGKNGLYTQELIKAMSKPNRTIEQVFKEVRANVLKISGDKQNPWENSNIIGDFYFKLD